MDGDVQTIVASYLSDAIRDVLDALASLATAATANCKWEQEPGEYVWNFSRSGDDLAVSVIFSDDGEQQPCFEGSFRYRRFCNDVLTSLHKIRDSFGLSGFEEEWGYPFPAEASQKLESANDSAPAQ